MTTALGFILFMAALILFAFLSYLLSVVIHEFGHAIPMYIFTKKPVDIFIGSWGNKNDSFIIKLYKFTVFVSKKRWYFPIGLCSGQNSHLTPLQHIVVFAMGPLSSFVLAILGFYFVFAYDMHGGLKFITFIFLSISSLLLVSSLNPTKKPIPLSSGGITYRDGYWIKKYFLLLFKDKDYLKKYDHLNSLLANGNNEAFIRNFKKYASNGFNSLDMVKNAAYLFFNNADYNEASKLFEELEISRNLEYNEFYLKAYCEYYTGNYSIAKLYNTKALEYKPNYLPSLVLKLEWDIEEGKNNEIEKLFKRVKESKSKDFYEHFILGRISINKGKIEEAIESFEQAQKYNPNETSSLMYLGVSHAKNGNLQKSKAIYETLELNKTEKAFEYTCIGYLLIELYEYKKSIEYLLEALKIEHTNIYALNNMSFALNCLGRYNDALQYANKGISLTQDKYYLYTNKAFAQLMLGNLEEGKATNESGLSLNPNSSHAYRNLGLYYKEKGNLPLAKEYLLKAIELDKTTIYAKPLLTEVEKLLNQKTHQ